MSKLIEIMTQTQLVTACIQWGLRNRPKTIKPGGKYSIAIRDSNGEKIVDIYENEPPKPMQPKPAKKKRTTTK